MAYTAVSSPAPTMKMIERLSIVRMQSSSSPTVAGSAEQLHTPDYDGPMSC
jgi:hypothetical protein